MTAQYSNAEQQDALRLGHARVDITPAEGIPMGGYAARRHGATGIADRLFADVIVLEQSGQRWMWVALDLIGVADGWAWVARKRMARVVDMPAEMVTLLPSHTHFGPSTYGDITSNERLQAYVDGLLDQLDVAAKEAALSVEAVTPHVGVADVSAIVYNRRVRRRDGRVFTAFTLPLPEELSDGTFGTIDPHLTAIRFDRADGRPKLLFYSVAIHPVVGVNDYYDISADYPGVTRRIVEAAVNVPVVFALGAAANLVPIERGTGQRERIGTFVAGALLQAVSNVPASEAAISAAVPVRLSAHNERTNVPTQYRPTPEEGDRRLKELNAALESARADGDQAREGDIQGQIDRWRMMMGHAKRRGPGDTVPLEVTAVALGDLGLVALPGEIFVETGDRIRALSPFPRTLVLTMANQDTGYLVTRSALWEGGYEVDVTMFAAESEAIVVDRAVAALVRAWDAQLKAP